MELVTEPDIHDAKTAGDFARELQLLLRTLGASHANLEKGEMRIEANVSVSKSDELGTKVEVKNLNSFRSVERAIAFEVDRQIALLESGEQVQQETRGWDEGGQKTFRQRSKEGSADYRYFPEPDLPKLRISEIPTLRTETLVESLPELPWDRRARYEELGLSTESATYLGSTIERGVFFDRVVSKLEGDKEAVKISANYIISDLGGWYSKHGGEEFEKINSDEFVVLIKMVQDGKLSSRGAKDALASLAAEGGSAHEVVERLGLAQVSDEGALGAIADDVIAANPVPVSEYKSGKETAIQYLVGQAMKASRGAGNPSLLKKLLEEKLK